MRHTNGGARHSRPYNTYALKRAKKRLLSALVSALLTALMIAVFALVPGAREYLNNALGITNIQGGMAGPDARRASLPPSVRTMREEQVAEVFECEEWRELEAA